MRAFVLVLIGCALIGGIAVVKAISLSNEYQRGEAEVRRTLGQLVILEKESLAERNTPVALDELGFRNPADGVYRYSAIIATIPNRRKIDLVLRAVREGDPPLRGDAWETDCEGKIQHVVDRSTETTMGGVLRYWFIRYWFIRHRGDSPTIGLTTREAAAEDAKKRQPSASEAASDRARWIEFHSWDVEKGCCRAVGKDADLCCLKPLRTLIELQNRPYRIHTGAAEAFPQCPAALVLALSDEPQSLIDPMAVASAALRSADPVRRAAGARLFAHLRDAVASEPGSAFAILAPSLEGTDMALFGPAATAVASVEARARMLAGSCRLADCSSELERRRIEEARPLLSEVEAVLPSVRQTAPRLLHPLIACAGDAGCTDRLGAAWALGLSGHPGRMAANALVSCLATSGDNPLRAVAERSLVRIGTDDESVVAAVRDAAPKAPSGDAQDTLLGILVRYRSTRDFACGALAQHAVEHIGSVRNSAAAALGRAGGVCGDVAISFAPYLKGTDLFAREESIRMLGLLGASGKPYLLEALQTPDLPDFTRLQIEQAIARADRPDDL